MQMPVVHLSRANQVWDAGSQGPWVSKTDLVQFERCAYRVFLAHQEGKLYDEFRTQSVLQILGLGQDHELDVVSDIEVVETVDIEVARAEGGLHRVNVHFYNHDYGIEGILDVIKFEDDVLFPVEIKSSGRLQPIFRKELAFYWRLLEPLQPSDLGHHEQKGYLLLSSSPEAEEVLISDRDLQLTDATVSEVRSSKTTEPLISRVQECSFCTLREEHISQMDTSRSLDLVLDIGPSRKKYFHRLGVYTVDELALINPKELRDSWAAISGPKSMPSEEQLSLMRTHAESHVSGQPKNLETGAIPLVSESIVLDLEYDSAPPGLIFLVGMGIVGEGNQVSIHQEFAADRNDELRILEFMQQILATYPDYPIVTWNGASADLPAIRNAWHRNGLRPSDIDDYYSRHIDLYQCAVRGVRLPIASLGLKDVSEYFAFKRKSSDVHGGLDALLMYFSYLRTTNKGLRTKLMTYNQDDIEATLFVLEKLAEISNYLPTTGVGN